MCVCVRVCGLTEDGAVAALHKGSKSGAGWDEWEPELGLTQVTSAPSEGTISSNLGAAGTLQRRTEDGLGRIPRLETTLAVWPSTGIWHNAFA